jgi:hypothetical protein
LCVNVIVKGSAVSWRSKFQTVATIVATSTREAKNIAVAEATMEMLWNTKLWAELNGMHNPMTLCVDNQAAITLLSKANCWREW